MVVAGERFDCPPPGFLALDGPVEALRLRLGVFVERVHALVQEHRQPLDVVARSHHRHRHIRARLPYGADELASQVQDPGEHVLDLGPLSGDESPRVL